MLCVSGTTNPGKGPGVSPRSSLYQRILVTLRLGWPISEMRPPSWYPRQRYEAIEGDPTTPWQMLLLVQTVILAPRKVNRLQQAAQESEEGAKYDEWVGGVWQLYGRVCGGVFRARGTGVMVAPMVAGAGGQGRVSTDQVWSSPANQASTAASHFRNSWCS